MWKRHLKEALLYLGLSFLVIVLEFEAYQELGTEGMFYSLPILFVLFAVAAEFGKAHPSKL